MLYHVIMKLYWYVILCFQLANDDTNCSKITLLSKNDKY